MLKKLGKGITIVNAVAFAVVILVGGISIYFTKDILHKAYKIEEMSKDIITVDSIHADAYRLVLAMHHFLIESDELYSNEAVETISVLKKKVEDYRADELKEMDQGKNLEIQHLDILLEDIKGLNVVKEIFESFLETGTFDRDKLIELEDFAYELEETTNKINMIHLDKIKKWTDESLSNMWIILFIYLVFISLGGLSIYVGHIVLLKKVVKPIKQLAAAAIEFSKGTLNTRVYTDSGTEIGQLYHSFNQMAEKLQANDEILRKFNEELERKVQERTFELQKANDQLHKTQNALIRTEKIAAVGQIAAGVTHEVKNPLQSLSIHTQMLLRELAEKFGPEFPAHESASLIKHEINRINDILKEFIKFAKFPEPHFFENDINQLVQEVVELISQSATNSGVTISLALRENVPRSKFDARQFKEVLINLSQNAISAMQNGGTLEIKTDVQSEDILLVVSDTGEGIREADLEKIFTPFFSTKKGGLGLGLPIVQRIVESHGGKINCTSRVGEGTIFEIILPLVRG